MSYLKRDFMKAVARVTLATALIAGITYPSLAPADRPAPQASAPAAAAAAPKQDTARAQTYHFDGKDIVVPAYVAPPSAAEREKFGTARDITFTQIKQTDAAKLATQYPATDAVNKFKQLQDGMTVDPKEYWIEFGKIHDENTHTDVLVLSYSGLELCNGFGCPTEVFVKDSGKPDSEYKLALSEQMVIPVQIRSKKGGQLVLDPTAGPENPVAPFYYFNPDTKTFLHPEDEAARQLKINPSYVPPPGDPENPPFDADAPDASNNAVTPNASPAPDSTATPAPNKATPAAPAPLKPPKP